MYGWVCETQYKEMNSKCMYVSVCMRTIACVRLTAMERERVCTNGYQAVAERSRHQQKHYRLRSLSVAWTLPTCEDVNIRRRRRRKLFWEIFEIVALACLYYRASICVLSRAICCCCCLDQNWQNIFITFVSQIVTNEFLIGKKIFPFKVWNW